MKLNCETEVLNTRRKLARLEARIESLRSDKHRSQRLRELSLESLTRLANQFKEEIARYEARQTVGRP
jgi:hypothetical protein